MYVPKKKTWNSLAEFKVHLERDTTEKVVSFNGFRLVTETAVYGIAFGELICEVKPNDSPATKRRPDGPRADQKRVGTHGSSDHAKPDRKKVSKAHPATVSKKISRRAKSPK